MLAAVVAMRQVAEYVLTGHVDGVQETSGGKASLPFAIMVVSAADGTGLEDLQASTQQMLAQQSAARRKEAAKQAANHGLDW